MDVLLGISCILILLTFHKSMSNPSCIMYERNKNNAPDASLPIHCNIGQVVCPEHVFSIPTEVTEARLVVCVSKQAGSCLFTWPMQLKALADTRHMVLAIREQHFASGNDTSTCFNVTLPKSVNGVISVTAIIQLYHQWESIAWMESALAYTGPDGNVVVRGNTVYRNSVDNSCSGVNQCRRWHGLKLNYSQPTCVGSLCRTIVYLSLRGDQKRFVQIEMRVDSTRTVCSGLMRSCVLIVEKLYGGKFVLQVRVILPDHRVCAFSRTISSKICGDPPIAYALSSSTILTTAPQHSLPSAWMWLVLAITVCLTVLTVIGILIYKRIHRNVTTGYSSVRGRERLNNHDFRRCSGDLHELLQLNTTTCQHVVIEDGKQENMMTMTHTLNDYGDDVI